MKKNTLSALSLAIVVMATLFVASCSGDKKTEAVRDTTVDSLQKVIDQKDNELNDFVGVFNEIQEGFRLIEVAENNVSVIRDGENTNKADQIRESIRNIQQRMQHNRELIENLQKKLREGTLRSEVLQKTITNFMKQLDEKNIELDQLRVELERKDIHIAELDQTVADPNANVSDLKEETE
jgi:Arc/MetJ-type ribon-helix-helix transcriptional regulator